MKSGGKNLNTNNKQPLKNNGKKLKQTALKKADNNKGRKRNIRKKQIRKESTSSLSREIKACDLAFSQYVRLLNASPAGIVQCFTCSHRAFWKKAGIENGHYMSRGNKATRWLKLNCEPQCTQCNSYLQGNLKVFAQRLVEKHGEGVLEYLDKESKKNVSLTVIKVKKLREYFEQQVIKLKQKLRL